MSEVPHTVGVDIGGTNVKACAITCEGSILVKAQFNTHDSALAEWSNSVRDLLEDWKGSLGNPLGIGVASPGIIGGDHRSVVWMKGRMEALVGFEWTEFLSSPSFVPVINDAKAALLAEAWIGAAGGARNALLLTLGTGVGGAAIVDGRLLHGAMGRAGHLGHISLDPFGARDIVGTPGSLEDLVGSATLAARSEGRFNDAKTLVNAARAGDSGALEIWRRSVQCLAAGIVSLINVLDPEVVILGGGMARAGADLFAPLAAAMADIEWRPFGFNDPLSSGGGQACRKPTCGVPVVTAALGEYAGAIGAARFAMTQGPQNGQEEG